MVELFLFSFCFNSFFSVSKRIKYNEKIAYHLYIFTVHMTVEISKLKYNEIIHEIPYFSVLLQRTTEMKRENKIPNDNQVLSHFAWHPVRLRTRRISLALFSAMQCGDIAKSKNNNDREKKTKRVVN